MIDCYHFSLPKSCVLREYCPEQDKMAAEIQNHEVQTSHQIVLKVLDDILNDFGITRSEAKTQVELVGAIPTIQTTKSEHINMTLAGAIPSLANAIVAAQIFEARGGPSQKITIDLRRAHNYLDPDIGMTPTINGQVRI